MRPFQTLEQHAPPSQSLHDWRNTRQARATARQWALAVVVAVAALLGTAELRAAAFTFPGNVGTGTIPDPPSPGSLSIPFAVSGLSKPTVTVSVTVQLTHGFVGDLDAVLTSPDGRARMVVFSRLGGVRSTAFGFAANLAGAYTFTDNSAGDLWASASNIGDTAIPPGDYRALSAGAPQRSDNGGCPTSLTGVFGGLTASQANGTWTLTLTDAVAGDTGTVTAAFLRIDDAPPTLFGDGFDSVTTLGLTSKGSLAVSRCTNKIQADFNGDGLTDYVLARPVGTDYVWLVRYNTGSGTLTPEAQALTFNLGKTDNFVDTLDIDGDRIADASVWNSATAAYTVRRSSRGLDAVIVIPHGQVGDDPTQSGDYDGDGRDDLAVFHAPSVSDPDGPMAVVIRSTANGSVRAITVGTGVQGDAFPTSGFDYSGDGIADVSVQQADTSVPADARFRYFDGRTGSMFADFLWGKSSDFIVPGNFVGNRQFDTTTRRTVSGQRQYASRDSQNGDAAPIQTFGITGDNSIGGDYDGDGLSDLAVWRPSATPNASKFIIRSSVDTAVVWEPVFGQAPTVNTADVPVAGSRVH